MKHKIQCIQCGSVDKYSDENFWWDDHGYGYSTKLVRCKHCDQINIVRYQEDFGFDVNNDMRWYEQKRNSLQ